ncbi:diguanylate cyclase (GGDEF)-like protein [Agrobacterium larrymoorei]|uniref:diguanylate cyclase n=1 Tax=Agrobacterium larrymoorei TaxID=160699 RepID=A0AAJ2BEP4_9HYPH|nr:GGDEF domain-containing protein [Agrobacterium larrymoorei]MDR6103582.1 diguanylate cyclase (GGDEF)-like protein [Agrobacterium larrymoorei]
MQDHFAYLLPFIMFTFGVVFLGLQAIGFRPGRYWGLGYILGAAGFALPMVLPEGFDLFGALLADFLFLAAFVLYGHALLVQFGAPTYVRVRLGAAIAAYLVVCFFILVQPNLRNELATSDMGLALLLAPSIFLVRRKTRNLMDKLLLVAVSLVVAETLMRVGIFLWFTSGASPESVGAYFASDYSYLAQFTASICGFLMALSVLGSAIAGVIEQHRLDADHDPLTGLLNRRGFDLSAPDFRLTPPPAGAVLICDIDHFKSVNDRFGHATGDRVIIALASLLKETLPASAKIARFGGEEFVAYVPDLPASQLAILANMARSAFAVRNWSAGPLPVNITSSFGVSAIALGDHSIHDAISRADGFLYRAKEAGRNQVMQEGIAVLGATPAASLKVVSS